MKLVTKITVCFTIPMVAILIVMGVTTLSVLFPHIRNWEEDVKDHIVAEEINNLRTRTTNLESLSSLNFGHITNDVIIMKEYAGDIFNQTLPIIKYYSRYFAVSSVDPSLPPGGLTNGINANYSVWYNKNNPTGNELAETYLRNSSIMDNAWRMLWKSNSKYAGLYVGFEDGLFVHLPYQRLNHYPTLSYTCLTNNQPTVGYDPRCRNWYILAKNDQSKVHFTEPYNDAGTGKVLISASHAIKDINGNFIGAVSIDISMQDLENFILSEKILDNGYTYLMDTAGKLIVYPSLARDRVYTVFEKESMKQTDFDTIKNTNGLGQIDINGKKTIYSKVSGTDYIVVMTVPNGDIVKPTDDIKKKVNTSIGVAIAVVVIITIVTIVTSIFVNVMMSKKVTRPIKDMNEVTMNINAGKLDVEMGQINATAPEIQLIWGEYRKLLLAIQFSNREYYKGNPRKSLEILIQVEKMLEETRNVRGLGVAWNNMGLAYMEMEDDKEREKAEDYFEKSIENAKELYQLADEERDRNKMQFFKIMEANRLMNLGLYYANEGDTRAAVKEYEKSIKLHRKYDNKLGEVKAYGNLGLLYLDIGQDSKAKAQFQEAYTISSESYEERKTDKNCEVLQYAVMNMGIYYKRQGDNKRALPCFNLALCLRNTIDTNLKNVCLMHLAEIHNELSDDSLADDIQSYICKPKHALFVLDCSGSMKGGFIKQCRESIKTIVKDYMGPNDTASLITFNDHPVLVFKNKNVGEKRNDILLKIERKTNCGRGTAFYDAVNNGIQTIEREMEDGNTQEQWLIALTDGEDNGSTNTPRTVSKKIRQSGINVIVITVGRLDNINDIKMIADSAETGIHIEANDVETIREAFDTVANIINRGQVNVENF